MPQDNTMSNIDESKLRKDIYNVMKKHFHGFGDTSHDVATDFTETKITEFINVYYDYLLK